MDNLKNWADKNRKDIDKVNPPASEMWDQISGSLDSLEKKRYPGIWAVMKYAAAILLLGVVGYVYINSDPVPEKGYALHEISPELAETEFYYASQLEEKMLAIQSSGEEISPDVFKDMAQLDSIYNDLMQDLKDDADNVEVVEAMIQNYRLRLRLLEGILGRIEDKKDEDKNVAI